MSTYKTRFVLSLSMKYSDQVMEIDLRIWMNLSILPRLISFIFYEIFWNCFTKTNSFYYVFILLFFSAKIITFITSLCIRACNKVLNKMSLRNFLLKNKKTTILIFFFQFLWFFELLLICFYVIFKILLHSKLIFKFDLV